MDDLGSVLKVVDSSGTVKNSYSYDPYGLSLNKSETVANPWQYASGYYDANTGLDKFGTRYYDPQTGRWTQMDPMGGSVGKIGSGNPYVYAGNVPTMQLDPSGRFTCRGSIGIVVASVLTGDFAIVVADLSFLATVDAVAIGAAVLGLAGVFAVVAVSLLVVIVAIDAATTACFGTPLF